MQLEFAQAMADFKNMFPDMDRDVIEAVLRANQGAVDATIDQLLAMSTDNQVDWVEVRILKEVFEIYFSFRTRSSVRSWMVIQGGRLHREATLRAPDLVRY